MVEGVPTWAHPESSLPAADEVLELGNGLRCTRAELAVALERVRVRDAAAAEARAASPCWACGHPLREHVYNGAESRCHCGCDRAYQVRP